MKIFSDVKGYFPYINYNFRRFTDISPASDGNFIGNELRFWRRLSLVGLANTLHLSEQTRLRLEDELQQIHRVRTELSEQLGSLTRQKNSLSEQLIAARKELERQTDTILRLAKEKEEMNKEHGEMCAQITACERENRHQGEVVGIRFYSEIVIFMD